MLTPSEHDRENNGRYPQQYKIFDAETSVSVPVSKLLRVADSGFVECPVILPAGHKKNGHEEELSY